MWWLLAIACSQPKPSALAVGPVTDQTPPPPPAPVEPAPREPTEPRYAATGVLVAWSGALDAKPGISRSRDDAAALAHELRQRVVAGEDLGAIARASSDDPSAGRGGRLGTWLTGTMDHDFECAVAAVEPGAIGPVAETPFGFWVVRRDPVVRVHVGQILVSFAGAWRSTATRTEADAEARAEDALKHLEAGEPLREVAAAFSEKGASDADLGYLVPGQFVPAVETAALALEPGEHTAIVHSPYGFHVLVRLD
jgi:peptidyl-prolyl cis-trans isomerase SurA